MEAVLKEFVESPDRQLFLLNLPLEHDLKEVVRRYAQEISRGMVARGFLFQQVDNPTSIYSDQATFRMQRSGHPVYIQWWTGTASRITAYYRGRSSSAGSLDELVEKIDRMNKKLNKLTGGGE